MKLTMNVDTECARVSLKGVHALTSGSVYDPLVLEFPVGIEFDAESITVRLRRNSSSGVVASFTEFRKDPENPSIAIGQLNLTGAAMQAWVNEPREDPRVTAWIEVTQAASVTYAACDIPVILTAGDGTGEGSESVYPTEKEMLNAVKSAVDGLRTEILGVGYTQIIRGKTVPVGEIIGFLPTGSSDPLTEFDGDAVYVDVRTNTLYVVDSSRGLTAMTPVLTNVKDVLLKTVGGSSRSLSTMADDAGGTPTVTFLDTAYVLGRVSPDMTSFESESKEPVDRSPHMLYVDIDTDCIYRYSETKRQFLELADTGEAADSAITDVQFITGPAGRAPETEVIGGVAKVTGILDCAVLRGSFNESRTQFKPEGSGDFVPGDPRILYVNTAGTPVSLYIFNEETGSFDALDLVDPVDPKSFVKKINLNGADVTPTDGVINLGNLLVSAVFTGTYKDPGTFMISGSRADLRTGVLYVDTEEGAAYVYDETHDKLDLAVRATGEPNVIEQIKVNGAVVAPEGKTVDLGSFITKAVILGDLSAPELFITAGGDRITEGTPGVLYISRDKNSVYVWDPSLRVFKTVVKPSGQDNVIETIKMNDKIIPVSAEKLVDLGALLDKAVVTGVIDESGTMFTTTGSSEKVRGDNRQLYLDTNTWRTYWYNGYKFQEVGPGSFNGVLVNERDMPVTESKRIDVGRVVRQIMVNGSPLTPFDDGVVDVIAPSVAEATAQRVVDSASYDPSRSLVAISFTSHLVDIGSVIFRTSVNGDAELTVDISTLASSLVSGSSTLRASTFEVWIRNNASANSVIALPPEVTYRSTGAKCTIDWVSTPGNTVTLRAGQVVYMTFRVAPDFGTVSIPKVHASVYLVS